jgi:Na+/H+ antiporter NhaC
MKRLKDRFFAFTDAPMTWTRAIMLGFGIWVFALIFMGQVPSLIIYSADQYVGNLIDFTKDIPGVNKQGLNPKQIQIVRDLVANGVQMTFLVVLLVFMYFWQEKKRKRTGARGMEDTVKGYMSGK